MFCYKWFISSCFCALLSIVLVSSSSVAASIPLFTSTLPTLSDPPSVAGLQFADYGFRFNISETELVTRVGGRFENSIGVDRDIFAVIMSLSSSADFPSGSVPPRFDPLKIVATTTITIPGTAPDINRPIVSASIFQPSAPPLTPLFLPSGDYALIFGVDAFGVASTSGIGAVRDHADINAPDYIERNAFANSGQWTTSDADGFYFFIIPEPSSIVLGLISCLCIGCSYFVSRRKRS